MTRFCAHVGQLLVFVVLLSGCGWWDAADDSDLDDDLPQLSLLGEGSVPVSTLPAEKLELNLKPGDRFPLVKTVTQTLTQASAGGPATSRSQLRLRLVIEVEEVREGRKRLAVRYQGVQYAHDVAGRQVEYDSDSPPHPVPLEVQAYHGLVNNGFSFWIGPDNQLIELVGFDAFLERCVRDVPPELRQTVLINLAAGSGDEGIANFVDDSIGLLPAGPADSPVSPHLGDSGGDRSADSHPGDGGRGFSVRVGETWVRERQVVQPIPMSLSTKYTLKKITDQVAEIDILGSIAASSTYGPPGRPNQGVRLTVRRGDSFGSCLIDRKTGLPLKSEVERNLEMVVQLPDGVEVEQRKQIVTTIQAFPQQGAAAVQAQAPSPVVQTSADATLENPPPRRVSAASHVAPR